MRFGSLLSATCLGVALALALAGSAYAQEAPIPELAPADHDVVMSESFMRAHPDLLYRLRGLGALQRGENGQAEAYFRRAARYADKLSQAFLAQMLWDGTGIPQDRALAYAWIDLAAERGTPMLLAERERYWATLDATERERAVREGKAIYAEYADAVAQPRLEREMRRALKDDVGSRTSNRSAQLNLCVGDWRVKDGEVICNRTVSSTRYYQDRFWKPAQYWQWQEQQLSAPRGEIRLGTPETLPKEGS